MTRASRAPLLPRTSQDYHLESFKNLREAMQKTNTLCAVMISPAGPEIHVINRSGRASLRTATTRRQLSSLDAHTSLPALLTALYEPLPVRREAEPIKLTAGQTVIVTNDTSAAASATVLPVNWPGSFESAGLTQGAEMFVGQYLFTGMETSSAYLQVDRVSLAVAGGLRSHAVAGEQQHESRPSMPQASYAVVRYTQYTVARYTLVRVACRRWSPTASSVSSRTAACWRASH